jgi:hypothetical protein
MTEVRCVPLHAFSKVSMRVYVYVTFEFGLVIKSDTHTLMLAVGERDRIPVFDRRKRA